MSIYQQLFSLIRFMTLWTIILVLAQTQSILDLHFLTWVVLTMGSYFSFIEPCYYRIGDYYLRGWKRFVFVDCLVHFTLFYWVFFNIPYHFSFVRLWNVILLLIFYVLLFTPETVYDVPLTRLIVPFGVASLLYVVLLFLYRCCEEKKRKTKR